MKIQDKSLVKRIENYLREEPDIELQSEIIALINDPQKAEELADRIGANFLFGTAGLRGKMQAGYSRMNIVTVYRFAHALGTLITQSKNDAVVVVGFDARNKSTIFAEEVADILGRFSIKCYIARYGIPTPLCAFATKNLKADYGVMITASHNPSFDNGIKVFAHNGAQLHGSILKDIEEAMINAPLRSDFLSEYPSRNSCLPIAEEVFDNYFSAIHKNQFFAKEDKDFSVKIVYTPLHGVGNNFFERALNEEEFYNIATVEEQRAPDGNFPTVLFPNPEEEHTLDLAHQKAEALQYDWVFANDPDADRLQVSCRTKNGDFQKLSGNEMGVLLGFFAIEKAKKEGIEPIVASSIVSSRMLSEMAEQLSAYYVDAITGFSNIAHAALISEAATKGTLVFAYEEAIGFLVGKTVLDKDGISTAARFMEIAAFLKKKNISVWEFLDQLYVRFGLFANYQWSLRFDGIDAKDQMSSIMQKFRHLSAKNLFSYRNQNDWEMYDLNSERRGPYDNLKANVIIFEIKKNARFIIRPSGTEPKIKFYLELIYQVEDPSMLQRKKEFLDSTLLDFRSKIEAAIV